MARSFALGILLALSLSILVLGNGSPVVLQPDDATFSSSERSALLGAVTRLESVLATSFPVPRHRLTGQGWTATDFAAFTAGKVSQFGFETVVVQGVRGSAGSQVWILAGVNVGTRTAWIPVEPMPTDRANEWQLGFVPTLVSGGALRFEASYLNYATVIAFPVNLPPVAGIRRPLTVLVAGERETIYGYGSADADGQIILYQWTIDDGDPIETTTWALRHVFDETGEFVITLTVTDNRGATATTSLEVEVLEEDPGCSCGS